MREKLAAILNTEILRKTRLKFYVTKNRSLYLRILRLEPRRYIFSFRIYF